MTLPDIALFFMAAMAGGAVNAVAGGGTFIVFPLLIWGGLGSVQANIMSTIALWPGSVSSVFAYRREISVSRKNLINLAIISILGSAIGTATLLLTPEALFQRLVPWLLLIATLIFTFGRRFIKSGLPHEGGKKILFIQFCIALYGGYFGAGIGILMLAMLQMMGMQSIHRMNAIKTILGSAINAVAVVIFISAGRVVWPLAAVMISGAVAGGYFGARYALKVSPQKVRMFVSCIGFAMTAYFFLHGA